MQKTTNLDTLDSLELLLQLKKEENIPIQQIVDEDGNTLLHKAIMFSQLDVVRYLIHHYPILCSVKNNFSAHPIHLAVVKNEMPILRLVSKNSRKFVNKRDIYGYTPPQYAAVSGQYETLKYLLDFSNGKYNKLTKKGKLNLLHLGVQSGSLDVVQYLLMKMGIGYLKNRTSDGATVFHLAAARGNDEILDYLLALKPAKYVKNYKDITGSTCFHDAAENGHHKCLKLLFDSGMDIFEPDYESITPYQLAITSKNEECVNFAKNIKLLVTENNFLKDNAKMSTNDFDAANSVTQNLNLKKISLKRLGSMLRLRRAKDVNQDQAYLYTQRFRPAPVSLPQSSKISLIQSNPPLLLSENEDDLCDSAIEDLINHVHSNFLRNKQDVYLNVNGNVNNNNNNIKNNDLDAQKRKLIANTSNHVKYARKMDRERIETSLGLIIKNSLSNTPAPKLTQSQIAAAAAENKNSSNNVKNFVTSIKTEDDLSSVKSDLKSDDENCIKNEIHQIENNENCKKDIKKENSNENLNDKNNYQHQARSMDKRRCNSLNPYIKKYSTEKIIDAPNGYLASKNLENNLKRYSFSYLSKSGMDNDALIEQQQNPAYYRSSSLNRNILNTEHLKIFLKYNNHNNKYIDANLLNEYLIYNKYLSENNLLSKSDSFFSPNSIKHKRHNLNYKISQNSVKKNRDALESNILFEHLVNGNKSEQFDLDDPEDIENVISSYTNGKFSKSISNISNIRTKKNILEASIIPFYETKLLNSLSNNNLAQNNSNICILRESFRLQNKPTHQAKQSQTNISISSNNLGEKEPNSNGYISLDTTNSSSNYFNNINLNLDEKKEYYNDNKADGFFKNNNLEDNSKKSDSSTAIYANSSSNSETSESTPTNDFENIINNEMPSTSQSTIMIPPPPPNLIDATSTLSRCLNKKLNINNTNTLNVNKAFINIDSESLLNAKQNLKSVKSTSSNETTDQPSTSQSSDKSSSSSESNSNTLTPSSCAPMSFFLSNTNNAKKNDRLLNEIKNHRLYNIKKDYVLDYLDRSNNANSPSSSLSINNYASSSKTNEETKINRSSSIEPSISKNQFPKNANTIKTNLNSPNSKLNGLKSQEKTISISTSSTSSISLSSSSSTSSTSENGSHLIKKNISNTLSASNSTNMSPMVNKFNSCTRTDKIAFCSTLQSQKSRIVNRNDINGLSTFRSGRSSSNVISSKTSSSSSDNLGEVIVGVELIEGTDQKMTTKTSYISEKINYFRNMNLALGRNINETDKNNNNSNKKKEKIESNNDNSLNSSKLKKIIQEEKYESELDKVFKKRALLLQNSY